MANLFWKKHAKRTLNLVSKPFASEEEFENVVFETKEILEDIFLIKRQIRGGKKPGIPDIVGINSNGEVCIVELKNVTVSASIIPQVLKYAFWAQENPDAIMNLWLTAHRKPEDVEIDWDSYEVRIVIIAPAIDRSTLELVAKIKYLVDLIEVKRWVVGGNHFLLVDKLESEEPKKVRTVRGLEVYDRAFYEIYHNKQSVDAFLKFANQIGRLVRTNRWPLEKKFKKEYCAFYHGVTIAFGINWTSSKGFAFTFKLPKSVAQKFQPKGIKMDRYDEPWKRAVYIVDPTKTKVKAFVPLFAHAAKSQTGR